MTTAITAAITAAISVLGNQQTGVAWALPQGACDCHVHVFGPVERFPYDAARGYTPPDASIADLRVLHEFLGLQRVVIVHPSPYGADNRVSVYAARVLGSRARVVAVIDPFSVTDVELDALARGAVVGIRLNFKSTGVGDVELARRALLRAAERVQRLQWHVQIFAEIGMVAALADDIRRCAVPVVIDHFGLPDVARGVGAPDFQALVSLVRDGAVTVKVSAGYRVTRRADWSDLDVFARALIEANAAAVVWGSDWPHPGDRPPGTVGTDVVPFQRVDNGHALQCLRRWCGDDEALLAQILVANPARLYGFDQD